MNDRRINDTSYAAAQALLDVVASALHPSVHRDFWEEAFQIVKAAIEAYEIQGQREAARLRPSPN